MSFVIEFVKGIINFYPNSLHSETYKYKNINDLKEMIDEYLKGYG